MNGAPGKGAKGNGGAGSPVLRAAAQAVAQAVRPSGLIVPESLTAAELPFLQAFTAGERAQPPGAPRVFQLAWLLRVAMLTNEGRGVGFMFAEGQPARSLAAGLRQVAARLDEIAEAVEQGKPIPDHQPEEAAPEGEKKAEPPPDA